MMAMCPMNKKEKEHVPVLQHEVIENLFGPRDGIYIDATFGRGSHSEAILQQLNAKGKLIALDRDKEAFLYGKRELGFDFRFSIYHLAFSQLASLLENLQLLGAIDGLLLDLGVSSPQLDHPQRGFSFLRDGPLDMRMDTSTGVDAASWLSTVDEATLANVLWTYGEEKKSRHIAKAIIKARENAPIKTTLDLANIISHTLSSYSSKKNKHPATRTFQAIRLHINKELQELEELLSQVLWILKIGGRLLVISFHSLEDRIVKQFIKKQEKGKSLPRDLPIKQHEFVPRLQSLGRAVRPKEAEIKANPRSRSAILRIAEKLS